MGAPKTEFAAVIADVFEEYKLLREIVAGLDAAGWETVTPDGTWTVRDQVSHLAQGDRAALLSLTDPDRFADLVRGRDTRRVSERRKRNVGELMDWWDEQRIALVDAYRRNDPTRRVPWRGPAMSVMTSATARLMETWAHGVDIRETFRIPVEDTTRLRHIAHLGVLTMNFSFVSHGLPQPVSPVRVELRSGTGDSWLFGPECAENTVRGTALDFCFVVTQRRPLGETALETIGPVARQWMTVAQAFGGPATVARSRVSGGVRPGAH